MHSDSYFIWLFLRRIHTLLICLKAIRVMIRYLTRKNVFTKGVCTHINVPRYFFVSMRKPKTVVVLVPTQIRLLIQTRDTILKRMCKRVLRTTIHRTGKKPYLQKRTEKCNNPIYCILLIEFLIRHNLVFFL